MDYIVFGKAWIKEKGRNFFHESIKNRPHPPLCWRNIWMVPKPNKGSSILLCISFQTLRAKKTRCKSLTVSSDGRLEQERPQWNIYAQNQTSFSLSAEGKIPTIFIIIIYLRRLTWLIYTSVLPSNWNLDKTFALTGQLGQVHMAKNNSSLLHELRKAIWLNKMCKLVQTVLAIGPRKNSKN